MSEEGGPPISTIFMLHEGLSQLITMVTLFCSLSLLFRRTDHPPQKYAKWRDKSCDFRSTLAVCISKDIQVTDLISKLQLSFDNSNAYKDKCLLCIA